MVRAGRHLTPAFYFSTEIIIRHAGLAFWLAWLIAGAVIAGVLLLDA